MGFAVFLKCVLFSLCGLVAGVAGLVRRGGEFLFGAIACVVGAALVWGVYVAAIGMLEHTWTVRSAGFWIAMVIGVAGVLLLAGGGRGSLEPRRQG